MKDSADKKTADWVGEKRPVGRPETGEAKSNAQRQKEYRDRLKDAGMVTLTVFIPKEMMVALDNFIQFKDISKDVVVQRCIKRELMRKR